MYVYSTYLVRSMLTFLQPRERKNSYFFTEIRAGLATFFAMSYIIAVNSNITSESGGRCVCPPESMADLCDTNTEYLLCVNAVRQDLVTATAAIAALTSFCMGLFANMPLGMAPGMGLNAYFAYNVRHLPDRLSGLFTNSRRAGCWLSWLRSVMRHATIASVVVQSSPIGIY
jgi:xanthine/uracil/vitamin C permease (AzgA family)